MIDRKKRGGKRKKNQKEKQVNIIIISIEKMYYWHESQASIFFKDFHRDP